MKPSLDLALRARNWFWYWRVRQISGLSNARLDAACFGDKARRRSFDRLQETASSPNDVAVANGKTLLKALNHWSSVNNQSCELFQQAAQDFDSKLWLLLARQPTDFAGYHAHLLSFSGRIGWERIHKPSEAAFLTDTWSSLWLWRKMRSAEFDEMILELSTEASPDAVGALLALFLEASKEGDRDHTSAIRTAVSGLLMRFESELGVEERVVSLIKRLIEDRVFDRPLIEHFGNAETQARKAGSSKRSGARSRLLDQEIHQYINRPERDRSRVPSDFCRCHSNGVTLWVKTQPPSAILGGESDAGSRSEPESGIYRHATIDHIAMAFAHEAGVIYDIN